MGKLHNDRIVAWLAGAVMSALILTFAYQAPSLPTELGTFKSPATGRHFDLPVKTDQSSGQVLVVYRLLTDSHGRRWEEPVYDFGTLMIDPSKLGGLADPELRWLAKQSLATRMSLALVLLAALWLPLWLIPGKAGEPEER